MIATLVVALVAVGAFDLFDQDQQPRILGEDSGNDHDVTQTVTQDEGVSECLIGQESFSKTHCESKTSEEQCSGAKQDWFCDYKVDQTCERSTENKTCRVLRPSQTDILQDAKCCTWDGSQCSYDDTDPMANFCDNAGLYQLCDDALPSVWTGSASCAGLTLLQMQTYCANDATWDAARYCRYTCFMNGFGYDDNACVVAAGVTS